MPKPLYMVYKKNTRISSFHQMQVQTMSVFCLPDILSDSVPKSDL